MIKSGYQEGIYYNENFGTPTGEMEENIRELLSENHGVGILGGYYDDGFSICMVSELTMQLLGFSTSEEFIEKTGGLMRGLVRESDWSEDGFRSLTGACELYLCGKERNIWVRLVKHDAVLAPRKKLWLASVCDMDALYREKLQVNRIASEKKEQELAQHKKLERVNRALEKQKAELEQTLSDLKMNTEVISAIGKIYKRIYSIDIARDEYEEISVDGEIGSRTGRHGIIKGHFADACRQVIHEKYRQDMADFLDVDTLPVRLSKREEISKEYQTADGNWHLGRFIVQKRDSKKCVTRVLFTIQIINEQKKQEIEYEKRLAGIAEEAQRASVSKTDFLRRMSHDIRTPINGIRGMIEIADHCAEDLRKQKECRDKIWEASGYLLSLVNSVLDMNKLESGAVTLEQVPFDLNQLLSETDIMAEMQATEHGLIYTTDKDKRRIVHPSLIGSPSHIKQVLLNLAGNAVKYNRENGSITVWCEELSFDGTTALYRFACVDTGIGMSKEFQKHVFEPFSQEGRNNARTRYDGSGLGLSIVKALVDQMNGKIEFESAVGIGTSFFVTLPLRVDPNPQGFLPTGDETRINLDGVRVLVAEDNPLNLEIAVFCLEQHGAKVTPTHNGKAAVEAFASSGLSEYDVILMDIMMPVMNGYEATRKIRSMARPDAKRVPILAMSANAFQDDVMKSKAAGMNDHLAKPIGSDSLLRAVMHYAHR